MDQASFSILLGLGSGALIAGIAVGVVVTYRGSGIINLAIGGYAMLAGYAFWALEHRRARASRSPRRRRWCVAPALRDGGRRGGRARRLPAAAQPPPLAKLVASLGDPADAAGVDAARVRHAAATSSRRSCREPWSRCSAASIPVDRFIIAGIVIVATVALAAVYRWTRFGLATRAASENEVSGMLRGLSPTRLASGQLADRRPDRRGSSGSSPRRSPSSTRDTLPLQIVPALAAALLAGLSSISIACAAGFGIGVLYSLITWMSGLSWFPTSGGVPLPGVTGPADVPDHHRRDVPARRAASRVAAQLVERGLPEVPRPQAAAEHRAAAGRGRARWR